MDPKHPKEPEKFVKWAKSQGISWEDCKWYLIKTNRCTEMEALILGATYYARNKS